MTTSVQDIVKLFVDHLEANVADPDQRRKNQSKKWIYDDIPRPDITSYPRISIIPAAASINQRFLNSTKEQALLPINIVVYIKKGQKLILSDTTYRDVELLAYLETQIRDTLDGSTFLTSLQAISTRSWLITENTVYGPDVITRTLTYQNQTIR